MLNFYTALGLISSTSDRMTCAVGQCVAWLSVFMALTTAGIVILRALGVGSIAAQESVVFMHAALLMLASAYTLSENRHVRVDIFHQRFSPLTIAWLELLGTVLLLLPLALFTLLISWDFVIQSWLNSETSQNAGGLGGIYWLKSFIIANGILLCVQALAILASQLMKLTYQHD